MQKLNDLVRNVVGKVWSGLMWVVRPIAFLLRHLIGSWQPPAWVGIARSTLAPIGSWIATHAAIGLLAVTIAVGALAGPRLAKVDWGSWWASLKSVQADRAGKGNVTVKVRAPTRTVIEDDGKARPVTLVFSASAAPLARVGKEAVDVTMTPTLAGRWLWTDATHLEFTPNDDWPIGVTYSIELGAKALAPQVKSDHEFSFESPRFEMKISEATFYQDPVQFSLRKAVYEVTFSHPVNPATFEKRLKLTSDNSGQNLFSHPEDASKITVTYDKFRVHASVFSEPLPIPQQTGSLSLSIDPGVVAQRGGNASPEELRRALQIPGLYSLDITELAQLIVTGDNDEPENIIRVATGMPVHEKEMARVTSAFLLPEKEDGDDSAWSDPSEVTDEVLRKSKRIVLNATPAEREITDAHSFKFVAPPGRYLLVRIEKGLTSAGGYRLGETHDEIIRVRRSAPELSIMSKGSLLALSGEKKLPLVVRDLPGVRVELGRLLPQQLQHLVTQSQGDMTRPEFTSGITPDSLTERFEKKIPLDLKPGKTHYETVDFAEYLRADAADRRGIFVLTVQGYDPSKKDSGDAEPGVRPAYSGEEGEGDGGGDAAQGDSDDQNIDPTTITDRRLVIVTDLGIISKTGVDGTRDVFVQSIANGQPVAGASVEIWGRNGAVLVTQATDAEGVAHVRSLTGFNREKTPVALVVRKAGDMSFLPLNRSDRMLDMSRFDVGGVSSNGLPNQIQAFLFSDRGIYRPGETINIGIVAKSQGWAQKLADLPVEAEVVDARGLVVRREKLKLGTGGMAEFSHATQENSPTGNMTINLNLARDSGTNAPSATETPPLRLGSLSVKVQEFMPDRMKVSAHLSSAPTDGWVSPKDLSAKVNVQNLFGTPAPKRRVEGHLTLTPAYPAFKAYPDYQFLDPQHAKEKFTDDLPKTETDEAGNVDLPLGLQRYAQASYQMYLLVNAFEPEGGRSVAADVAALVSDRPYMVGYKVDGDLGYVSRDSVRNVSWLAIDPSAQKTAVQGLKLVRIERRVVSVLVKQANGTYKYESRPKEAVLGSEAFAIATAGARAQLPTHTPGNFALEVRDPQGLTLSRVEYSVAGNGNVSRSLDRNAELQLALNKKDYDPGDEIELSIRAPYAGAGLITIERDHVVAHKWFQTTETASTQKVTLPKDFEGNGYVTVQFARDLASDEIYMSPMSYGVAPFATSRAKRTNAIELHAPDLIKPGQTVKIRLDSKLPARAVVFAVDEGILQVARYQAPDPLKFFFQKRALEVSTQQTLDLILPEFKKLMHSAAPGGDGESDLGKNLNPFKRKHDKPVAYWSGVVDVTGTREFSYTVPESFNGSLRIMAVAINDDTAGAAATKTVVRGDLVLLPNVPVAMTPGDEVEIGVGVSNNAKGSGKDAPVSLTLSVSGGLEVVGPAQQTLKINENSEGSTKFTVRAKPGDQAQLGSATVSFTAQTQSAKAHLATDLSVRPASAYVTLVQTGIFKGSGELNSQADMYPNYQRSEAAVSSSPWAFTGGLIQFLDVYPYGCTEQITSQVMPSVILSSQPGLAEQLLKRQRSVSGADKALDNPVPDPAKVFSKYLALVRARQASDGGFSMWPGGASDLFATTYVVNTLVEARDRKLPVPNDMLQRANVYLQARLGQGLQQSWEWRTGAQSAYLLTRQGIVTTAALTNLRESLRTRLQATRDKNEVLRIKRDLGAAYLAASYQILKQDAVADELMQPEFDFSVNNTDPTRDWGWEYYYDPLVRQATVLQLTARHFPKLLKNVPISFWEGLSKTIAGGYFQSHSASVVMLAVDAYAAAAADASAGKLAITTIDRKGLAKALDLPQQLRLAKSSVAPDTARLKLSNGGDLPLFYSWSESGYERKVASEAKTQGLEIIREFLDAKGKVVTSAEVGQELTARVRVRATDRVTVPQVALVDILPGGLEPVLTSPSDNEDPNVPLWRQRLGGAGTWSIDYADIREDRVIFFGTVSKTMTEVTYKVKATNVGKFVVPGAYAEGMYERRIFGRSAGGSLEITPVTK